MIPVVWSTWQEEESPGAVDRFQNFYSGVVAPTAFFNGTYSFEEWDCNTANYEMAYNEVVSIESPLMMSVTIEQNRAHTFDVSATIEITDEITTTENKIFFIITNWAEYSTENPWHYLVVSKSDELNMELSTVGETATYNATLSVTMEPDWFVEDLHVVAVVQSFGSREVLQAAQIQFSGTGINEILPVTEVSLAQNYPNPFNPSTTISYSLIERSSVKLDVYNQKGQKIKTLINSTKDAGNHQIIWNGTNSSGKPVSSGIYLYKIHSEAPGGGKYTSVKKMILLK